MNNSLENIINFLKDISGTDKILPDSDIFKDIGMVGDDFHEMIEKYAEMFSVDMSNYLWYFHSNEEGQSIGGFFFAPPYNRVKRIPVTPLMLTEFASRGKWEIDYPIHSLPKKRYDILINKILIGIFVISVLIWLIIKMIH